MAGRWHWLFVLCCRCVVWAAQMVQRGVHCLVDHRLALFRVLAVRHPFGADPLGRIAQSFHRCAMYCSRFRTPSLSSSSTWAGAEEVAADVVPRRRGFFPLARVRLIAFQGEARVLLTQSTKSGRTAWMNLSTSPGVYMSSTCNGVAAL